MNFVDVILQGVALRALGSGALSWPERRVLIVSDLHLGKSERMARRGGAMLPPYEARDTLLRLDAVLDATDPATVICLGDSLDDNAARAGLDDTEAQWIARMQAGRDWIWIAGNHDPAPSDLGGRALARVGIGPLTFRHIATPAPGEVSGHYHPKARLGVRGKSVSRPCFLHDDRHMILPAFGTYTGGLDWTAAPFAALMGDGACAILTGPRPCAVPLPRRRAA
ncbi:ligase-associated DNA damage response endonuclease PdeM [Maribius pontilimi]|uniref:Ligase-associated DNA damage response endonuclease PdeM n=1 Tax=Palleronia pontilimi TaxID=1964209 RepID=A0A934MCH5_9RHOB|nr:ligase-associated DNA damage response endonuclease PdeM [Palleronia pontilimi]MBJ3761266.1 ligase-associated DNA damage response endonuclease PdeM [Palleronia pontilimi]